MVWGRAFPTFPTEVAEAASTLNESLATAREAVRAARLVVAAKTALATTQGVGASDLGAAALEGLVTAARTAVDALLDDVGAHVLLVPLPKKGLAYALPDAMSVPSSAPAGALASALGRETASLPVWQRAFAPESLFVGGNAHFLKTVAEATTDAGDGDRPTFGRDTYWGYVALLGGSTDLGAATTLATYAVQLFGSSRRAADVTATRGDADLVASGLAVRPGPRGGTLALEWQPVDARPLDDGWTAVPVAYAVIRSERPEAMTARSVLDLFSTVELREGLAGRHGAQVLKVARYNPVVHRYVDESSLTPNQAYYYHVAVKTRLDGPGGRREERPYALLSASVRYRPAPREVPQGRHGTPPDWWRSPSVVRVVPAFGRLLDRVNAAIDSASAAVTRVTGISQASLAALDRLIAKLDRLVGEIDVVVGQIQAAYTTPSANIHVTLRTGKGSVTGMIGDLAKALDDTSDAERPSFDTGDEYVCGAMVVVAAPSEDAFLRAWALVELLFGPADAEDPVVAGVRSVEAEIARAAVVLTNPEPSRTFNEDMSPRPAGQGDASCE